MSWRLVGPAGLCRMDRALVARIAAGEGLGALALSTTAVVLVGAGAYGFSFGIWRAPEQALYSAIKLPALLLALALTTTTVNAMLALLLRASLTLRQSAVCVLVALATTAAILGALSPVSCLIALSVPGPDPAVFGLPLTHPLAEAANHAAQPLLLYHTAIIAVAGVLGNVRLFSLLARLTARRDIALRVLVAWMLVDFLAGSELSWIFRPFLGRPHRAPELVSGEMFDGSFFEEIGEALVNALGPVGIASLVLLLVTGVIATFLLARLDGLLVEVAAGARGLDVTGDEARFSVPWDLVTAVAQRESPALFEDAREVVIALRESPAQQLIVRFRAPADAEALVTRIDALRGRRAGPGPFRTATRQHDHNAT